MINAPLRHIWKRFAKHFPRLACEINFARRYHRFERDLWMTSKFCTRTGTSVDVGVNEGIYSRWMAKHSRLVYGFECNPHLIPRLKKFLPRNVVLNECALSSQSTEIPLRFDPRNTGIGTIEAKNGLDQNPGINTIETIIVSTRTLDSFALPTVDFVKIDVEGHELEVLKGARALLERDHPTLLVEIEERHCPGNLVAVPAWLRNMGYQPYILSASAFELVAINELESHAAAGKNNYCFRA